MQKDHHDDNHQQGGLENCVDDRADGLFNKDCRIVDDTIFDALREIRTQLAHPLLDAFGRSQGV